MDGNLSGKGNVIASLLQTSNITQPLMIGDRYHDILGAKENNIDSAGVLYGYGSREEMENAKADYIFTDVSSLSDFILG